MDKPNFMPMQEPQKIPKLMDKSQNVTSIYKSTSQGIMLRN